jgi:uncharacterized protein YjbI with pentapeptide repeats
VDLTGAILIGANLEGIHFHKADLSEADLGEADLRAAYLAGANLVQTWISENQLLMARSIKGAIMPDGTKHAQKRQ